MIDDIVIGRISPVHYDSSLAFHSLLNHSSFIISCVSTCSYFFFYDLSFVYGLCDFFFTEILARLACIKINPAPICLQPTISDKLFRKYEL